MDVESTYVLTSRDPATFLVQRYTSILFVVFSRRKTDLKKIQPAIFYFFVAYCEPEHHGAKNECLKIRVVVWPMAMHPQGINFFL
jgi:hypothetical protein